MSKRIRTPKYRRTLMKEAAMANDATIIRKKLLCEKHMALLFKSAQALIVCQAAPISVLQIAVLMIHDLFTVWNDRAALANASGFVRTALSDEDISSGFSKPIRKLTEHIITE